MTSIEARKLLQYTLMGFFDEPDLRQASSYSQIKDFAVSQSAIMIMGQRFLLSEPNLEIKIEPVPQNKGGIKYMIDSSLNPKTIYLCPGGLYQRDIVISGELMKYSDEPEAVGMFNLFQRELKRQFNKHPSYPYWIGKEAAVMQRAGKRLTDDTRGPFSLPLE
jgi:hypothetical protein